MSGIENAKAIPIYVHEWFIDSLLYHFQGWAVHVKKSETVLWLVSGSLIILMLSFILKLSKCVVRLCPSLLSMQYLLKRLWWLQWKRYQLFFSRISLFAENFAECSKLFVSVSFLLQNFSGKTETVRRKLAVMYVNELAIRLMWIEVSVVVLFITCGGIQDRSGMKKIAKVTSIPWHNEFSRSLLSKTFTHKSFIIFSLHTINFVFLSKRKRI